MENKTIIDLEEMKMVNEVLGSSLVAFGAKIKQMLFSMFSETGEDYRTFYIKGRKPDILSFGAALASEKKYMDSYLKNGLNDPGVLKNRYRLERAIEKFEKETGIKWPLK